jgi:flagellar hook assembly protein FlgD
VSWDGTNRYGDRVGSGVYFVRMEAGSTTETQKVVLVR